MKTVLAALAAGMIAVSPFAAFAEEAAPAAEAPAAEAPATEAPAAEAPAAVEKELKDGTKISIEGEMVSVVAADGTKTPAPDGDHVTVDGETIKVMEGKLVKE